MISPTAVSIGCWRPTVIRSGTILPLTGKFSVFPLRNTTSAPAHYNAGVDACPPSAHAAETLAELSRRGWRQSVLSASRRDYLIEQVAARGLQGYFTELLGLADIYGVSKVQVGKQWLAQSGIAPAACVMVGDTQHDAEVAKALGTKCVLYTGGHQSRARLEAVCPNVIDDLAQLPQLLETL